MQEDLGFHDDRSSFFMTPFTRPFVLSLVSCFCLGTAAFAENIFRSRAEQVRAERQPIADQGNGFYRNPILAGNYGDPSVVKVGKDYYMAHSRGNGMMLWHSRDLVNWAPVTRQTFEGLSKIWAVDLQVVNERFYLYMPVGVFEGHPESSPYMGNFVSTADKPEGPWSKPVRIDVIPITDSYYTGIDPGFVCTPEGKKYLYTDHGFVMPLTEDGLKATAVPTLVYKGWLYPKDWIVQGFCLESPKLLLRDGWYYLTSAQGGTSGPSTSHMAVVARSKSPTGPWENSPHNPLIHTFSRAEKWWQQGHATLIEGPDGSWWAIYHGRQNGAMSIGRQTLMLPIEWTREGWPVVKHGVNAADLIPMPKKGENVGHGLPISDNFASDTLGLQWVVALADQLRIKAGQGRLSVEATEAGTSLALAVNNRSFEATVEVNCPEGVVAGLVFGKDEGLKTDGKIVSYNQGDVWRTLDTDVAVKTPGHLWLRIRNLEEDLSFACSDDGEHWTTFQNGTHGGDNTVRLFAKGKGTASFRHFSYLGLD